MNIFTERKALCYVWNIKNTKFSHTVESFKPAGTEDSYGNVASISVLAFIHSFGSTVPPFLILS